MQPRCPTIQGTLVPFLYPVLLFNTSRWISRPFCTSIRRYNETAPTPDSITSQSQDATPPQLPEEGSHLNPPPTDYSRSIFNDHATISLHAGAGGHGCISFLREKYIAAGPANGGDGGTGGNIYIQAVRSETSLHKLSRRNIIRAGRGKNGMGKTRGGERGNDVIVQVPVGTVVKETERIDPVLIEQERRKEEMAKEGTGDVKGPWKWDRKKWLLYPAITPEDIATAEFPRLPKARGSALSMTAVKGPISLDLSRPMERPLLLAAGAVGGLGNPHFVTKMVPRPKFATKGEQGLTVTIELELKLLADVGLVGLPNAGKSTLLRAVSKSRARVGNWAFTTLQPNIGTVVLDNHRGRPLASAAFEDGEPRTNFTIADIPGLVEDAHLDKGLGISFLRHVERAKVLAFVIDLSKGDAVDALKALWREVSEYEKMQIVEDKEKDAESLIQWSHKRYSKETRVINPWAIEPSAAQLPSIAGKPWFVVATKADLPGTQEIFAELKAYLDAVNVGAASHPSGQNGYWKGKLEAFPVSAINGHGVERITACTLGLLDD